MTDLTDLLQRKQELIQAEHRRQQEQNAPALEIQHIDAQIVAAQQQQIVDAYNALAAQYGAAHIAALNHLGAMVDALSLAKFDLARAAGRDAVNAVLQATELHKSAEQYRSGRGAEWRRYYETHLTDPDIHNAAAARYTTIENIATQRANQDDKRPVLPPLPAPPNIIQHLAAWVADGGPLGTAQRQERQGLCFALTGDIFDEQMPLTRSLMYKRIGF